LLFFLLILYFNGFFLNIYILFLGSFGYICFIFGLFFSQLGRLSLPDSRGSLLAVFSSFAFFLGGPIRLRLLFLGAPSICLASAPSPPNPSRPTELIEGRLGESSIHRRALMAAPKPIWVRQAEEAKLKSEAETAAAAKAAFEATFKALAAAPGDDDKDADPAPPSPAEPASPESDDDAPAPPGPVDPSKCSAAGPGIGGGSAGTPSTFTVVAKDRHSRRLTAGGALVRVRVSPAAAVGGDDLEGAVKDNGDGSYTVTYVVPKRGNYMVHVDLDGAPVMGSPFPVFFSGSTVTPSAAFPTALPAVSSAYPNMVNQTMPNMPNYTGAPSSAFPSLLGAMPGSSAGSSSGVMLPGVGASLGEICRDYMNGRCTKVETDCKFTHPPQQLLMSMLAATSSVSALGHAPLAPSAAAMAAAQAIMAAQALQAHAAQAKAAGGASGDGSFQTCIKISKLDFLTR
jgi:hypothetical protein